MQFIRIYMRRRDFTVAMIAATAGCTGDTNGEDGTTDSTIQPEIQWSYDDADQDIATVIPTDDAYYLFDRGGYLIKLVRETGEQLWYTSVGRSPSYEPIKSGNYITFAEMYSGRPKYYIFNQNGDLHSQIDASVLTNKYIRNHNITGTEQNLIITIETRALDGDTNLSAYIVDPAEGTVVNSKDWNTFAGASARTTDGYIIIDDSSIQFVDDSYNQMWHNSTKFDRLQQVSVSDQGEIVVDAVNEGSVGMIHLSSEGEKIHTERYRGAPDEDVVFSTGSITTNGVTILPTSVDPNDESTLRKYNHEYNAIVDSHSIEGDLLSMVAYRGDLLLAIGGGVRNAGTPDGKVELQQLRISDFTKIKSWEFDSSNQGRIIHAEDKGATYVEDGTISRVKLI